MGNQSHRNAQLLLNLHFPDSVRLQLQQHRVSFLVPCVSRTVTPSVHSTSAFHTFYSSGSRGEAGVVNFVWRWCDWVPGLSAPSYSWVPTCVTQSLKRYPRCGVKGARFAICLPFSSEYSVNAAWAWLIMQGYCICLVHVAETVVIFQMQKAANKHSLPYNSKSVMGERTAPHFTGDSSPLTNRLVT